MQTSRPSVGYHILALVTILVWGTTFASTKVLLMHGLTPPEIMLYRFVIAYAMTWVFARKVWSDSWVDELLLAVAGFTGGTLYFLAENTAIDYTITSNVALVVCVTPLLTALLTSAVYRERITGRLAVGSAVALLGVAAFLPAQVMRRLAALGADEALAALARNGSFGYQTRCNARDLIRDAALRQSIDVQRSEDEQRWYDYDIRSGM